jgi:hypothetical protein
MPTNIFDSFNRNAAGAFDMVQRTAEQRARNQAGSALARGETQNAFSALSNAGMLEDARRVQVGQQADADRERQQKFQDEDRGFADQQRRASVLKQITEGLKEVPAGQRKEQLDRVMPVFGKVGIDATPFSTLTEDDLSDAGLAMFGAEIDNQIQLFGQGGSVVAVDKKALGRNLQDPAASRVVYQDPLANEYRQAQIEATRARANAFDERLDLDRQSLDLRRAEQGRVNSTGDVMGPIYKKISAGEPLTPGETKLYEDSRLARMNPLDAALFDEPEAAMPPGPRPGVSTPPGGPVNAAAPPVAKAPLPARGPDRPPTPAPPRPSAGGLPPQARAALREGAVTEFGNGQQWTLRGGKPVRVK